MEIRKIPLFFFIFSVVLLPSVCIAVEPFDVMVSPVSVRNYGGTSADYTIKITNSQSVTDKFTILYTPPAIAAGWVTLEKNYIEVPAKSEVFVKITVSPPLQTDQGTYTFRIYVTSQLNKENVISKDIYFTVLKKYPVIISSFTPGAEEYLPDQNAKFVVEIKNLIASDLIDYSMNMVVTTPDNKQYGFTETMNFKPDEIKTLEKGIRLDKYAAPGEYKGTISLRSPTGEEVQFTTQSFKVKSVSNLEETRGIQKDWVDKITLISVTNKGNIDSTGVKIIEPVPKLWAWLITLYNESLTFEEGDNLIYQWNIGTLKPGESATVGYKISYVPGVMVLIIIAILLVLAIYEYQKPRISKKILHEGPAEIGRVFTVSVAFKNASRNMLRNVIMRDTVPPVLSLIKTFETLEPVTKKYDMGTELYWKFGNMKPSEERIVTYKVKVVIGVAGEFELPRAYAVFKDKSGVTRRVYSRFIKMGELKFK